MGTQAKYYQLKEGKAEVAVKRLKEDEDFYNTINDTELVIGKIDIDKSFFNLAQLIENLSGNSGLGDLMFFGEEIESEYEGECPVQFIGYKNVSRLSEMLSNTKIVMKDQLIKFFNESQDAPYEINQYKDLFDYYWIHYNSILKFYNVCNQKKSSILVLIS